MTMPPLDRQLSPITGWGRQHWVALAERQLRALRVFWQPHASRINLPGTASWSGEGSDGLEGYARSFLLAAALVAGSGGHDPSGHLDLYREGLLRGTDRLDEQAWPSLESGGQPLCEAASIALCLHLTRPWLWDLLDRKQQDRVAGWLYTAKRAYVAPNNWVMFRMVIQAFLASVGQAYCQEDLVVGLEKLDTWYVRAGWYRDGEARGFDYYNAWAFHLYPFFAASMMRESRPEWATEVHARSTRRLNEFLPAHLRFFGSDGAPIFYGRSLIYRYAAVVPLCMDALFGEGVVPPGVARRIASGAVSYFVERGAFDDQGILSRGWWGADMRLTQAYSGPASAYWSSKAFLALLIPDDHAFWTAEEEVGPTEDNPLPVVVAEAGLLLAPAPGGIARLLRHAPDSGVDEDSSDPLYTRFAYSSVTAPVFEGDVADNHFAVFHGDSPSQRGRIRGRSSLASANVIASSHVPTWEQATSRAPEHLTVDSICTARGPWEVRLHVVRGAAGRRVRETGYAVGALTEGGLVSDILPLVGYTSRSRVMIPTGTPLAAGPAHVPAVDGICDGEVAVFASAIHLGEDQIEASAPTARLILDDESVVLSVDDSRLGTFQLSLPREGDR